MIHRYLYDILTNGIQAITDNPLILDELFQDNYVLVSDEAASIKEYFIAKGLNIYNGYPRQDSVFPAVNIILGEEGEEEEVIGDSGGIITDETDPNYRSDIFTVIWGHTYRLLISTEHPDVTAYYYEIIKFVMLEGIHILIDDGCLNFQLSGNELAPDPRYLPEHLFARQLVFKCQREFQRIDKVSKMYRAVSISGIHVDKEGSLRDVGDVKTNVEPYTE